MTSHMIILLIIIFTSVTGTRFQFRGDINILQTTAINAVLEASSADIILHFEKAGFQEPTTANLRAPLGIVSFQVAVDDQNTNLTHALMAQAVAHARQVRRISHNVLVLVTSDDAAFLSVFAQWSLKGRLFVWAVKLVVFTRIQVHNVQHLHKAMARTNSLLVTPWTNSQRFIVSVVLPYSKPDIAPLLVATWTPQRGLSIPTVNQVFPEKFEKIKSSRKVYVTMVEDATHKPVLEKDPTAPGGQRLVFKGYMVTVLDYMARGLNFSYGFMESPDGTYGGKRTDGSWTGMVGQVFREEADLGLGPFVMTASRAGDVEYTSPVKIFGVRILAGQGKLKVDPWGFVLPLGPMVWAAAFAFLLVVPGLMFALSTSLSLKRRNWNEWEKLQFDFLSILLQETIKRDKNVLWWERVTVGVWLLTTLVLTRSYEGNLMSLLAVRHVPQPYQSLRAVLDDPEATMIWQKGSSNVELIRNAESGVFLDVHKAEGKGRVKFLAVPDYSSVLEKDVINGRHVIIDLEDNLLAVKSQHFSLKGRCSFYFGRETIVSQSVGMIGHKTNPLVHFMSKWVLSMNEAGLFDYWYTQAKPNSTSCVSLPSKVTISAPFSLSNSWAMFVLLLLGLSASLQVLLVEILYNMILH